jgi:hypothetical protein
VELDALDQVDDAVAGLRAAGCSAARERDRAGHDQVTAQNFSAERNVDDVVFGAGPRTDLAEVLNFRVEHLFFSFAAPQLGVAVETAGLNVELQSAAQRVSRQN